MRWAGHVACMGQMRNAHKIFVEYLKGRDHFEDLSIHGKIILQRILEEYVGKVCTGFNWLKIGTSGRIL
jgi:hypothetical protein